MDILIYGGSFDPPHQGHLKMLTAALKGLRPARAYIVVAYRSPLKAGARAAGAQRRRMTRRAVEAALPRSLRKNVTVSSFELRRKRTTCTYETLRHFRRRHPQAHLHFLAGSDSLKSFRNWRRPGELRASARFLIGRRPGAALPTPNPALPRFDVLPGIFPAVSSTELRCRLLAGQDTTGAIALSVLKIIHRLGLYGLAYHQRLARDLKPKRYRHTLSVARMALDLARRHGIDAERAALAGLMHDCGRAIPPNRMDAYVQTHRLRVPFFRNILRRQSLILHGYIGGDLAMRRYGITDPAVLSAIRKHTLGAPRMAPLDRLLYTADACSLDRTSPEARRIRAAANKDLKAGYREAVRTKILYVLMENAWMHPYASAVWNGTLP